MITDGVGRSLYATKKDLRSLKSDLSLLQNDLTSMNPDQAQRLYSRIHTKLNKFDGTLQANVDTVLNDVMLNKEKTLNQLPLIQTDDFHIYKASILRGHPNSTTNTSLSRKGTPSSVTMKLPQTLVSRVSKRPSTASVSKGLKPQIGSFTTTSTPQSRPLSGVNPANRSRKAIPSSLTQSIWESTPIAPKLSEADINKGLINLVNRGIVHRDVDLSPAFERGAPPFFAQKAKFYRPKQKPMLNDLSDCSLQLHDYSKSIENSQINNTSTKLGRSYSRGISGSRRESALGAQKLAINRIDDYKLSPEAEYASSNDDYRFKEIERRDVKRRGESSKGTSKILDNGFEYEFTILNGKTVRDNPEYISFQTDHGGLWSPIIRIINLLEILLTSYDVKTAHINGKKLASLASVFPSKPSLEQLLECVVNQDDVCPKLKIPALMYKGKNGATRAAVKIQTAWRRFYQVKQFTKLKTFLKTVMRIQRQIKCFLEYQQTKNRIKQQQERYLEEYREIEKKFKKDWPTLKNQKRVEIHICNLTFNEELPIDEFLHKQNLQITRLAALSDPSVEIIYITPYNLPPEVLGYYLKLMQLKGISNTQERFHVLCPDAYKMLPKHFSAMKALLYSFKTINRISQIIKGKCAYVVPGVPSNDNIKLSAVLKVPIMAGEPQKYAAFSTNAATRSLLQSCGIPIPPGSVTIKKERKFVEAFTALVAENLSINTWVFKMDHEVGERGYAWCSVDSIKAVQEIKSEIWQCYEDKEEEDIIEGLVKELKDTVATSFQSRIRFACPSVYNNYADYMKAFTQRGGIIEACPNHPASQISSVAISLFVDPAGSVKLVGSYDKILLSEFTTAGYFFPQKSLKTMNLASFCDVVGQTLYSKDVFGYFTVELVAFPESQISACRKGQKVNKIYWAVGITSYLTNATALTGFFDFLMNGKLDSASGKYTITKKSQEEKRCFAYFPILHHQGLTTMHTKAFFQMCRTNSVSYDIHAKEGSFFLLFDSLQSGVVGLLAAGKSKHQVVKYLHSACALIVHPKGASETKGHHHHSKKIKVDVPSIEEILKPISNLQKLYEKKYRTMRSYF